MDSRTRDSAERMHRIYEERFGNFEFLGKATRFAEDIHQVIDHAPLFEALTFDEIEALCDFMVCYAAPRNSELIREGEEGDFLVVILTGHANVLKRGEGGEDRIIATVGPGSTLGEMSMIDGQARFATCVTTEPLDFAVLDRQSLNDILVWLPRLGNKLLLLLLRLMANRLRDTSSQLLPHLGSSIL